MQYRVLSVLAIIFTLILFADTSWEFKNVECTSLDESFTVMEYCFLKSINRTYKYVSGRIKLLQVPITNVTLNWSFYKRANGYRPFLYNITFDFCKFMANRKNPVIRYFHDFMVPYSNVNHTCPYDHDLIVEKMPMSDLNYRLSDILPFPHGEYMLDATWWSYNVPRGNVKLHVTYK